MFFHSAKIVLCENEMPSPAQAPKVLISGCANNGMYLPLRILLKMLRYGHFCFSGHVNFDVLNAPWFNYWQIDTVASGAKLFQIKCRVTYLITRKAA